MNYFKKLSNRRLLELSVGVIYLWFGLLKFFPNLSPAESLAKNTIDILTCGIIPSNFSIVLLAIWESLVGVLLIFNVYNNTSIKAALIHMVFTFTPLFISPSDCFNSTPFELTLVGQYIFKNLILISVLIILNRSSKMNPSLT